MVEVTDGTGHTVRAEWMERAVALARELQARAMELQTPQERRQQAELDRLTGEREGASDHRLRGDGRRQRREQNQRQQQPVGRHQKERIVDRFRLRQHEGALAEIIQK